MTSNYLNNITERDQKRNKSVQPRPSAVNMTLPAFAAERQRLLWIDIFCPGGSAANPPHAAAAVDRWDRRTDARPFHRPCCACYARSVSSLHLLEAALNPCFQCQFLRATFLCGRTWRLTEKKHIGYINVICVS